MMALSALLIVLIAFVSYKLGKTAAPERPAVIVPREQRVAAQHAADISMREYVVVFVSGFFKLMPSDQQYKTNGEVLFVATPNNSGIGVIGEYRLAKSS